MLLYCGRINNRKTVAWKINFPKQFTTPSKAMSADGAAPMFLLLTVTRKVRRVATIHPISLPVLALLGNRKGKASKTKSYNGTLRTVQ